MLCNDGFGNCHAEVFNCRSTYSETVFNNVKTTFTAFFLLINDTTAYLHQKKETEFFFETLYETQDAWIYRWFGYITSWYFISDGLIAEILVIRYILPIIYS